MKWQCREKEIVQKDRFRQTEVVDGPEKVLEHSLYRFEEESAKQVSRET